jgi:hypothetical protein
MEEQIDYEADVMDIGRLQYMLRASVADAATTTDVTRNRNGESKAERSSLEKQLQFVLDTVTRLLTRISSTRPVVFKQRRDHRGATYPTSKTREFLASLFADPAARARFMARSMLYRRAADMRIISVPEGVDLDDDDAVPQRARKRPEDFANPKDYYDDRNGSVFEAPKQLRETCQLSAKLHCLFGWWLGFEEQAPLKEGKDERWRQWAMWQLAAKKTYDVREYDHTLSQALGGKWPGRTHSNTKWGPFMDVGNTIKVDWERLEAIMYVLGKNLKDGGWDGWMKLHVFKNIWAQPFGGVWEKSYLSWRLEEDWDPSWVLRKDSKVDQQDPYDVSGVYIRVVSYLCASSLSWLSFISALSPFLAHYRNISAQGLTIEVLLAGREFKRVNEDITAHRMGSSDNINHDEQGTHFSVLCLRATHVVPPGAPEPPQFGFCDIPGTAKDGPRDPSHPVVHFQGFARTFDLDDPKSHAGGLHDLEMDMEEPILSPGVSLWDAQHPTLCGRVCMMPDGEVRWSMVTCYETGIEDERYVVYRAEGIQFGGRQSARGVVGTWFHG